jgi:hypothetical protein
MGCGCSGNNTADRSFEHTRKLAEVFGRVLFSERNETIEVEIYQGLDGWCFREKGVGETIKPIYTLVFKDELL